MQVEERLEDIGIDLEEPGGEKGKTAPALRTGNLVFTSAFSSDEQGKLGGDIPATQGYHEVRDAITVRVSRTVDAVSELVADCEPAEGMQE